MTSKHLSSKIQSSALRQACSRFPSGVTIVTRCGQNKLYSGLTVSSFISVSLDPPLVLVSIRSTSAFLNVDNEPFFYAVNVLSESQADMSTRFAQSQKDRFESGTWVAGKTGAPILCDAVAVFECVLVTRLEAGDHILLIGRVVECGEGEGEALVHYRSRYHSLRTEVPAPAGT